jgi:uncharacterized membrane protein YeaQ/YmgE (transglycosylase-associated protein family)
MSMMLSAIVGGLVGWALTVLTPRAQRLHIIAGMIMGIGGAMLGGWLLVPLFHSSSADENGIATTAALVPVLGAALSFGLMSLVSLATRGAGR